MFLDEYTLDKRIKTGNEADVFTCIRKDDGKEFVVKKIKNCYWTNVGYSWQVIREISVLLKARGNPYIVQMEDYFFEHNTVYIVLEKAICNMEDVRPFTSSKQASGAVECILGGLAFLKSHGIIHRDLKEANILVYPNNIFKICDFNLCGNVKDQDHVVQTVWWRSPEIYDKRSYDYGADMWSLGIIILNMFKKRFTLSECGSDQKKIRDALNKINVNVSRSRKMTELATQILVDKKHRVVIDELSHVYNRPQFEIKMNKDHEDTMWQIIADGYIDHKKSRDTWERLFVIVTECENALSYVYKDICLSCYIIAVKLDLACNKHTIKNPSYNYENCKRWEKLVCEKYLWAW